MKLQIFVWLAILAYSHGSPSEMIQIDNGLNRGDWGPPDLCPNASWATSFEIKYAALGHIDDTALTGIRIYCQSSDGTLVGSAISEEATYGDWLDLRSCNAGEFFDAMRANVVPEQGDFGDDLGMDNLQMSCSDGVILDGLYGTPALTLEEESLKLAREHIVFEGKETEAVHVIINEKESTKDAGEWGSWAFCTTGLRICGIETRVERDTTLTDDAGVVDLIMYCCSTA
ncbi:hypothetical protein SK128_005177 [Halocaridina rubra]|uniref:Vitelline membrane outer layer protein 1 n=1 Tax=Halocaridina rubra TaxID=373956 RepID=A0AAN8X2T7_HALRR